LRGSQSICQETAEAGEEVHLMRKKLVLALSAAAAALLAAGGASAPGGTTTSAMSAPVVVSTKSLPKLGTVLVNGAGRTLYMFVPDKRSRVTCVRTCAAVWPPLKLPSGAKPVAKGGAKRALLGSDRNPAGGRVVTYNRWPLYTYVADTAPGQAKGQALNLNGGLWYVLAPSGKVIRKK
jgi:predicted lipoprotein with Yx(FWY)xxD motif